MDKKFILAGAAAAAVVVIAALYLSARKGEGASVASSIGEAVGGGAVDLAEGVAVGVVGGIGSAVSLGNLPTPSETITDAQQCKIYLDEHGYLKASAACSAPAFFAALTM